MLKRLASYFVRGLLFLAPIALTIYVFVAVFSSVDGWLSLPVPGAGILVVVSLTTVLGFLLSHYFWRRLLSGFERLLDRLPLVRLLHTSVKDLMDAFVGDKKRFDRPVLVELAPGVKVIGFITRDSLEAFALPDHAAVYFPQAYNFAGQLVVVARGQITPLAVSSSEAMAFVVSGGVTGKAIAQAEASSAGMAAPA